MTNEEIIELRNDLVSLSIAITEMEKGVQGGFFNRAITIARENIDIVNKYNPLCQPNDIEYKFPYVGFLCKMCSKRLELVGIDKDILIFECNHCSFEGRISIPFSEYKEVTWINVKL